MFAVEKRKRKKKRVKVRYYDPTDMVIEAMLRAGLEELITNGYVSVSEDSEDEDNRRRVDSPYRLSLRVGKSITGQTFPEIDDTVLYVPRY